MTINPLLDVGLFAFHAALVAFNLAGWGWRRTRRAHLATITLTLASWLLLGIVHGVGYCPLTDWHWSVKRALGERDLPGSYVKYYLDRLTGTAWDPGIVDWIVVVPTLAALALSIVLNLRDRRRRSSPVISSRDA